MTTLLEASRQALEALKELKAVMPIFPKDGDCLIGYRDRYNAAQFKASETVSTLRQAIEQAEKPSPPPRQPLTNDEIRRIELTVHGYKREPLNVQAFARAIEAAHDIKEKKI